MNGVARFGRNVTGLASVYGAALAMHWMARVFLRRGRGASPRAFARFTCAPPTREAGGWMRSRTRSSQTWGANSGNFTALAHGTDPSIRVVALWNLSGR